MKITGIEIGEYRQFKNIKFDFTYPRDHPKAGQPLEKVCFIGQSGTGKTTLLNILWEFFKIVDDATQAKNIKDLIHSFEPNMFFYKHDLKFCIDSGGTKFEYIEENISDYTEQRSVQLSLMMEWLENINYFSSNVDKICLFIEDTIASTSSGHLYKQIREEDTILDTEWLQKKSESRKKEYEFIERSKSVSVSYRFAKHFWQYILFDIHNFDEQLKQIALELLKINSLTPNKLQARISSWQREHSNPRVEIAEKFLNPVLKKLYLEIDTDETKEPISIKTKSGVPVDSSNLSTGTKQLLSTAIAIYKSGIKDGVVLFDEPERSLFPDIQRELVRYYTSLAPEAQFFFATHSPIIAASFEPCERFILYFNEQGEVKVRNGVAPVGDDPNDILRQDFGMSPLMQEEGINAYQRYTALATEIKNEVDINRKMELLGERAELGNRYNFPALNETN